MDLIYKNKTHRKTTELEVMKIQGLFILMVHNLQPIFQLKIGKGISHQSIQKENIISLDAFSLLCSLLFWEF